MERRKICRYFERGSCKKQKCPFVHLKENRKNCEFYMKGYCKKGDNCNFYHPPKQNNREEDFPKKKAPVKPPKFVAKIQEKIQQPQEYANDLQQLENLQKQLKDEVIPETKQQQEQEKIRKVNQMLGFEFQSSEDESEEENIIEEKLQFNKIFPKKFPDLSKTRESKDVLKKNEEKYFSKMNFLQMIKSVQKPSEKQHLQIVRKFQDSFDEQEQKVYTIKLRPLLYQTQMNLHFQMVEDYLHLKIDSRQYPKKRVKLQFLNFSIPQAYKNKLIEYCMKFHQKSKLISVLKQLTNNFERIYEISKSKLQNQFFSRLEMQKKLKEKKEFISKPGTDKKQKRERKRIEKVQNPDAVVQKFAPEEKIDVGNMNYDITISPIFMQNCQYVVVEKILLFLQCRCEKQIIHVLEADRKQMRIGVKLRCRKCFNIIRIAFNRQVIQMKSSYLGKLGLQNGCLLDAGGVAWKIGCKCDAQIIKPKIYLPSQRASFNCHECFNNMSISFTNLKHYNPFVKEFQAQDGKQLLNRGTCKHMKQSFRWLRYGCCGRVFSCDQCHENGSAHPHEKIPGATMLCGFCSMEQAVSHECIFCKKELVRGIDKGGHWEGGLGCRDQALLSKKDAKKYTGMTKKK